MAITKATKTAGLVAFCVLHCAICLGDTTAGGHGTPVVVTVVGTNLSFLGWDTNLVHVMGAGTAVANGDYYEVANNYWTNGAQGMRGSPNSGTASITNSSGILYTNLSGGIEGLVRWTKGANGLNSPPYVYFHRRYSQALTTNYVYGALTNVSESYWSKPTLVALVGDSRCGYFPTWNYAGVGDTNDTSLGSTIQLGVSYPLFKFLWTSSLIYQYINVSYGGTYAEDAIGQYTNYVHGSMAGGAGTNYIVIIRTGINNLTRGDTGLATFTLLTNIAQRVVADGGIPILLTCEGNNNGVPSGSTERDKLNQYILGSGYRVADSASRFQDMSSVQGVVNTLDGIHLGTNAERQVSTLVDGAMLAPGRWPFSATPNTAATALYPNTFYSQQVLYGTNLSILPVIDSAAANLRLTNIATVFMMGAGITAAIGAYTNWPAEATALGVQVVWTNGGTGYWGVYDPAGAIAQVNILEFYSGPGPGATVIYDSTTGFLPLTPSQSLNVDAGGTKPGPTLIGVPYNYAQQAIAVYQTNAVPLFWVTPGGVINGDGRGITNSAPVVLSGGHTAAVQGISGGTNFFPLMGWNYTVSPGQASTNRIRVPYGMLLTNFYAGTETGIGAGTNHAYHVFSNGVSMNLKASFQGTGVSTPGSCSNLTQGVVVPAGTWLMVGVSNNCASAPANQSEWWTVQGVAQ